MKHRVGGPGRPGGREDVGLHLPLGLRAHPAPRAPTASASRRVHDLRPGRRRPPHRLRPPGPGPRPQAVHAPVGARRHQRGQERPHQRRRVRRPGHHARPSSKIADVYREYQARLPAGRGHGLRRPAGQRRRGCSSGTPTCWPSYQRRFRTSWSTSTRTPTGPRTSSSSCWARSTATSASSATRDQSIYKFRGRRHPQHPRVRGGVPRRHRRRARAELPVDPDHPRRRQRGHRQQPRAQAQGPVDRAGARARRSCATTPTTRPTRPSGWPTGSTTCTTRRTTAGATWPSSTGPTPRAG